MDELKRLNQIKMLKTSKTAPYHVLLNLELNEIENFDLLRWNLSVRTRNCFEKEGIETLIDLIKYSEEKLLKIRNFGFSSLNEIENRLSTIEFKDIEKKSEKVIGYKIPNRFLPYSSQLINGNFDFLDKFQMNTEEIKFLARYKVESNLINSELREDAYQKKQTMISVIEMLKSYSSYLDRYKKYSEYFEEKLESISSKRRNQLIISFAQIYIDDILLEIVESNFITAKIGDTKAYIKMVIEYDLDAFSLSKFIQWLSFDLNRDFVEFLHGVMKKEREFFILKSRIHKKTLEEIGNTVGITRQRIRQIERKTVNRAIEWMERYQLVEKIFAINNNIQFLILDECIKEIESFQQEFEYLLLKYVENSEKYKYLSELNAIVSNKFDLEEVYMMISLIPEIFDEEEYNEVLLRVTRDLVYSDIIKKYIEINYHRSGRVFHKHRLTHTNMYKRVLQKKFSMGLKVYDEQAMSFFREKLIEEYGEIDLPESNRAIAARIWDIGILCDRGTYKICDLVDIDVDLKNRIYMYIINSDRDVMLISSVFAVFREELKVHGIDNRYFLHGVLKRVFRDEFYFRKDCIMKTTTDSSISDEIVTFVEKHDYPIVTRQIQNEFPGATEAIINRTVAQSDIVNLFGRYIHISKIGLDDYYIGVIDQSIKNILSDMKVHHAQDLYFRVQNSNPSLWKQIYVEYPFSAFSVAEILFKDRYQFSRPFIAEQGLAINDKEQLIRIEADKNDRVSIKRLHGIVKSKKLHFPTILSIIELLLDTHYMINKDVMVKNELIDLSQRNLEEIESLIISYLEGTKTLLIRYLPIISLFPEINYEWTEWLIFSLIKKHSRRLEVGLTSNFYHRAYPIISMKGELDYDKYNEIQLGNNEVDVNNFLDFDDWIDDFTMDFEE